MMLGMTLLDMLLFLTEVTVQVLVTELLISQVIR